MFTNLLCEEALVGVQTLLVRAQPHGVKLACISLLVYLRSKAHSDLFQTCALVAQNYPAI